MLFNSTSFALFLTAVFIFYWFVFRNHKQQNLLLLVSSYSFYITWDYRFLSLLIVSTLLDYFSGLKIHNEHNPKVKYLWLMFSFIVNLGILGAFKYYNFFLTSFVSIFSQLGFQVNEWTLQIIIPVGISFYTFHGLSYVMDIYAKKIIPERNIINYAVFVSFFPLLVAGPIERATHLLPQITQARYFSNAKAVMGLRQMLWGLFKKIVIADNCADYVTTIFSDYEQYSASSLILAAVLFALQIYCDFSGYSDIAIGTARLFGIDLLRNFAFPYFSRDIAEFWRRWHISLSSWFRDYLYIPLGGNKVNIWLRIRNIFVVFIICGFWHGANWTYVAWGTLNALYYLPLLILNKTRENLGIVGRGRCLPTLKEFFQIVFTFALVTCSWVFFRSNNIYDALMYLRRIATNSWFVKPELIPSSLTIQIIILLTIEWIGRADNFAIERLLIDKRRIFRWSLYYYIVLAIYFFFDNEQQFIYFQF